LYKGTVA